MDININKDLAYTSQTTATSPKNVDGISLLGVSVNCTITGGRIGQRLVVYSSTGASFTITYVGGPTYVVGNCATLSVIKLPNGSWAYC